VDDGVSGQGVFDFCKRQAGSNLPEQSLHIDRLGIEVGTSNLDALLAIRS
jgi:hypothetical protein